MDHSRFKHAIDVKSFMVSLQVCVVALFSTLWAVIEGWFDGNQDFDKSYLTWELLWDWMMAFPWLPALYTGIFSTGLCLWIEVFSRELIQVESTNKNELQKSLSFAAQIIPDFEE